jgi:HlyD family secretion protein
VAAAQRDQARAELAKASADLERERPLFSGGLVPKAELDTFDAANGVAEAKLKNAEAALGVAEAKLRDTRIVSPASGLVITRNLEVGSTVVPGSPIFRVAASAPWVAAQVDERATGALRVGQPVRVVFETDPTRAQPGRVARLGAETDRVTEEREIDVVLDPPTSNRFLGQRAEVYIETARRQNVLRIPLDALVARDARTGVFVVVAGRARWRPVETGLRDRKHAEVLSGLTERDLVIVAAGPERKSIGEGVKVTVDPDRQERP